MKTFELFDPSFLPHSGCDLQFVLNFGELMVLVGENGIGKSTLLRRFYSSLPDKSRVMVEQKATDYFYDRKLGLFKEIFLSAAPAGLNLKAFHFLWEAFGLHQKEDRLLSHLSGGESQSLKLCLALSKESEVYFLDEPSQYLDLHRKHILKNFLEDLRKQNKIILVVEHNYDWIGAGSKVIELKSLEGVLKKGKEWII